MRAISPVLMLEGTRYALPPSGTTAVPFSSTMPPVTSSPVSATPQRPTLPSRRHGSYVGAGARALDPAGDGRYEVEYRVRQLYGSWRWLSAWGPVEFEGQGDTHRPVAIAGASRDLTELKR